MRRMSEMAALEYTARSSLNDVKVSLGRAMSV
jgi:hypothetical protein